MFQTQCQTFSKQHFITWKELCEAGDTLHILQIRKLRLMEVKKCSWLLVDPVFKLGAFGARDFGPFAYTRLHRGQLMGKKKQAKFHSKLPGCCCSVTQSRLTLRERMDCSTPGFPVLHHLLEFDQTHVHWVSDAIQPSHLLSSPSPALNLFQHQCLFQWIGSLHQVAKVLEFQLQHQSFQWIFRTDFL